MKSIEEYENRDYVKTIRVGNIIYFIGLFLGVMVIGSMISFIGSCQHNSDSKKRIKVSTQEFEKKYGITYQSGFKGIDFGDLFVCSLVIVGMIVLGFKYSQIYVG